MVEADRSETGSDLDYTRTITAAPSAILDRRSEASGGDFNF
jgi:hypothetical protein